MTATAAAAAAPTLRARRTALDTGHPVLARRDRSGDRHIPTKFGNPSKTHQVRAYDNGAELLYSYGTLVAARVPGVGFNLSPAWNYSATTNYYRGRFTGYGAQETRKLINSGQVRVMSQRSLERWARTA